LIVSRQIYKYQYNHLSVHISYISLTRNQSALMFAHIFTSNFPLEPFICTVV